MDAAEQTKMARKHVFCVNGAPEFLEVLREFLQDEKYNVTTTNFVPQTFDQIEALKPDLVIIDLVVGEQAGWDLLKRLDRDATTRDIPVIVFSTNPELLERAQADPDRYGGERFLRKPIDLDDLLEAVDDLIGDA